MSLGSLEIFFKKYKKGVATKSLCGMFNPYHITAMNLQQISSSTKVQLLVLGGHTLGVTYPQQPNLLWPLRSIEARGASFNLHGDAVELPADGEGVRSATEFDFDDFRVVADGYRNEEIYSAL